MTTATTTAGNDMQIDKSQKDLPLQQPCIEKQSAGRYALHTARLSCLGAGQLLLHRCLSKLQAIRASLENFGNNHALHHYMQHEGLEVQKAGLHSEATSDSCPNTLPRPPPPSLGSL